MVWVWWAAIFEGLGTILDDLRFKSVGICYWRRKTKPPSSRIPGRSQRFCFERAEVLHLWKIQCIARATSNVIPPPIRTYLGCLIVTGPHAALHWCEGPDHALQSHHLCDVPNLLLVDLAEVRKRIFGHTVPELALRCIKMY